MPNGDQVEELDQDKTIFALKSLIELIEKGTVRFESIRGLTADQIIEMAESEAAKAVQGANRLKELPD